MVFYKGALTYQDLESLPIPEILELTNMSLRIEKEINKASNK